jgi:manganese/iron transport system permease protein
MMAWAVLFGSASVYLGLLASYHFNLAAGSAIVLTATILFFIVLAIQNRKMERSTYAEAG